MRAGAFFCFKSLCVHRMMSSCFLPPPHINSVASSTDHKPLPLCTTYPAASLPPTQPAAAPVTASSGKAVLPLPPSNASQITEPALATAAGKSTVVVSAEQLASRSAAVAAVRAVNTTAEQPAFTAKEVDAILAALKLQPKVFIRASPQPANGTSQRVAPAALGDDICNTIGDIANKVLDTLSKIKLPALDENGMPRFDIK